MYTWQQQSADNIYGVDGGSVIYRRQAQTDSEGSTGEGSFTGQAKHKGFKLRQRHRQQERRQRIVYAGDKAAERKESCPCLVGENHQPRVEHDLEGSKMGKWSGRTSSVGKQHANKNVPGREYDKRRQSRAGRQQPTRTRRSSTSAVQGWSKG